MNASLPGAEVLAVSSTQHGFAVLLAVLRAGQTIPVCPLAIGHLLRDIIGLIQVLSSAESDRMVCTTPSPTSPLNFWRRLWWPSLALSSSPCGSGGLWSCMAAGQPSGSPSMLLPSLVLVCSTDLQGTPPPPSSPDNPSQIEPVEFSPDNTYKLLMDGGPIRAWLPVLLCVANLLPSWMGSI